MDNGGSLTLVVCGIKTKAKIPRNTSSQGKFECLGQVGFFFLVTIYITVSVIVQMLRHSKQNETRI